MIANYISEDNRFQELDEVFGQENILVTGLSPSAKATIIAEKYLKDHKQMLLVTNNLYQADKIETDILQYVDDSEVYKYPVQDIMTEEFSTQSPQLMSERVRTLTALAQGEKGLFIVPLNGFKKWLTPVDLWKDHQMTLKVGQDIDVDAFLNKLVNMGYRRESVVSHIGEFSLRGGIIDIYPLVGTPVRIELFDTEVDSIRDFDVETQRSNDNINQVEITTASDYIITDEVIQHLKNELKKAYEDAKSDTHFKKEFNYYLSEYVGRETPLTFAESYTKLLGGAKIYLKREDLNHTGAHKINNAIGQALLAKRMGKTKLVAETGAGQHGVASATIAALFDMDLIVFMGSEDIKRQQLNVFRMELLGAKVVSVSDGQGTLSDAVNKALQYWVNHVEDTHYLLGSALGPDPFPTMVRDFQSVIGNEIKSQILSKEGRLPDALVACVGGGSNSIGTFYPFIQDDVKLYGVEAAGKGRHTHNHALAIGKGKPGVLHGSKMYLIQNDDGHGQIELAHSISAGLDYPGIGPEHSYYNDIGRVSYVSATDNEAMEALITFSKVEGIIPAIESAHALSYVEKLAPNMDEKEIIVVTISGRGDKDMETIKQYKENGGEQNE